MLTVPFSDGTGELRRYPDFASRSVAARHVDVWCPPAYAADPAARFPVIYMQDGQNLFDPGLAFLGVDWGADEAVLRLQRSEGWPGAILVGVWNIPARRCEYCPQKPFASPAGQTQLARQAEWLGGAPFSDRYLKFLVDELKPQIDADFRTRPGPADTFVMGSSMGGLISLYALAEYPHVFGGAGCLSTHWPVGETLLVDYFSAALPAPGRHRLYFDFGTTTLDADYEPYQRRLDAALAAAGYRAGQDWLTRKFDGAEHSERAWRERVDVPLAFLLRPR